MATTVATVTAEGLFISTEVLEQLQLKPGTQVDVILYRHQEPTRLDDLQQLMLQTRGMLSSTPGLAEELQAERRDEDHRSKW